MLFARPAWAGLAISLIAGVANGFHAGVCTTSVVGRPMPMAAVGTQGVCTVAYAQRRRRPALLASAESPEGDNAKALAPPSTGKEGEGKKKAFDRRALFFSSLIALPVTSTPCQSQLYSPCMLERSVSHAETPSHGCTGSPSYTAVTSACSWHVQVGG